MKYAKPGGLDLSRRGLDRESRSLHMEKVSLDSRDFKQFEKWYLDKSQQSLCYKVSIFIFVSIETLDLNTLKKDISTDRENSISIGLNSRDLQA